jgi:hypothetical protein
MNLSPRRNPHNPAGGTQPIKGSALAVWRYLRGVALITGLPTMRFQVSRREIKEGTGIGSMNTIDSAIESLEAYGLLLRHPEPGSNDGHQYELLTLDESPVPLINATTITDTFRKLTDSLEQRASSLGGEQLNQWALLAYKARRLLS